MLKFFNMNLMTDVREILSKCKDEILDILDNGIFDNALVNILRITFVKFFHIDKIK